MRKVADRIWVVTAGTFPSNTYICETRPGEAVLIDTGLDGDAIEAALASLALKPVGVFCTHGHFDHLGSAAYFQKKFGIAVHLHSADVKTAKTNNFLLMAIKREERIKVPALVVVEHGFSTDVGDRRLRYLHAPGHTPGSCAIALDDQLFTGDTIYSRGLGLSKLPGERHDQLRESILNLWPDLGAYRVHPGHGPSADGSTIKTGNQALLGFLGLGDGSFEVVWDGTDVEGHA